MSEPLSVSASDPSMETRAVVLPPTSADAVAIDELLNAHGISCCIGRTVANLCSRIREGAGTVILSEEVLFAHSAVLRACISEQPVWSDLPIIVLSRSGIESPSLAQYLPDLGNVSVVERPVRTTTLISLVRFSLRARARQYQVREHLIERARAEKALRDAEQTERVARNEAERSSRIKDEFLATLSHELRTPLHAILGWSQVMRRSSDLNKSMAEGLTVIERNARSQAQIISDLLDMSSIMSGKIRLDVQHVDLANIVEAAINTVRPAAEAKDIRLHAVLDPHAKAARGDPSRLQQVFWNLLTNAVKFTPKGGRIWVSLERVSSHLEVSFSDNGSGIDPEFLPYVFDRFRQADSSTDRQHGGLGLGLSICKQLVELHGGTIDAKSRGKGAGSSFRVSLPLMAAIDDGRPSERAEHHPARATSSETISEMPRPDLHALKILVVDDEPDARALIQRLLSGCEATVATAASADEAMAVLAELKPDLVVSDIGMPGEDGYALMRRIRARNDSQSRTPAIALTAFARMTDRIKAIEAGYQMHLAKPVEPVELLAMVASWKRNSLDTLPPTAAQPAANR